MLKGVCKEGYIYLIDQYQRHKVANKHDWFIESVQEVEFEMLYGGAFIRKLGRNYNPDEAEEFFSKRPE